MIITAVRKSAVLVTVPVFAATPATRLTLAEAVRMAQTNSVDAAVALNELKAAYWAYRSFKADQIGRAHV